ncbi:MAG: TRAP transporter large permease subunit [Anaerolineae bacterium]
MEWYVVLAIMVGGLLLLFASGLPVAYSFLIVNLLGLYFLMGGRAALGLMVVSAFDAISSFVLVPVPLFILMGEIMLRSGVGPRALDALDKWIGRLPGRLSLLAVAGGTMLSTLSGSSMATTALLGSTLVPEMKRRGYNNEMSMGPILGSGGLAMIIPPTALGVLLGALAEISIAKLLIAGIIPGLFLAGLYVIYIVVRAVANPKIAPVYAVEHVPLKEKVFSLWYILPLGIVIFMVLVTIFIGVATPTEASALGVLGTLIVAALYRRLSLSVVQQSLVSGLRITVIVMMIIVGSKTFSQILAFTGASRGIIEVVVGLDISPLSIVVVMMVIVLIMGAFIDQISIMMITIPIFFPVITTLGFDPIWYGILLLVNLEIAGTSPPFGLVLFVMKSVVPGATLGEVYRAAIPFAVIDALGMGLMIAFPALVLWLPQLMLK